MQQLLNPPHRCSTSGGNSSWSCWSIFFGWIYPTTSSLMASSRRNYDQVTGNISCPIYPSMLVNGLRRFDLMNCLTRSCPYFLDDLRFGHYVTHGFLQIMMK